MDNVEELASKFGCKVGSPLPLIWGCFLVPRLSPWQLGMECTRGFAKGWPCGRDHTFLKEGKSP